MNGGTGRRIPWPRWCARWKGTSRTTERVPTRRDPGQTERARLRFEQAIHRGDSPRIEDFLNEAATVEQREGLLGVLLRTELAHRRGCGEIPTTEDYLSRFPTASTVVEEAFRTAAEATELLTDGTTTETGRIGATIIRPPGLGLRRRADEFPVIPSSLREQLGRRFPALEILGSLGEGGMGAVFKARQINLDRLVALKVIRHWPPQRREVRRSVPSRGPNLSQDEARPDCHDLRLRGKQWYALYPDGVDRGGRLEAALRRRATGATASDRGRSPSLRGPGVCPQAWRDPPDMKPAEHPARPASKRRFSSTSGWPRLSRGRRQT